MIQKNILRLENTIQAYPWGSPRFIAEFTGNDNPSGQPQAELWMGAHPRGPSIVIAGDRHVPLPQLISEHPKEILGPDAATAFNNVLPFLFKILAAEKPLSIQVHPDKIQARQGFIAENNKGIPVDAPERNYHDDNHKPELIYALTPFTALCGFRNPQEIASYLDILAPRALEKEKALLLSEGLRPFYTAIMTLTSEKKHEILKESVQSAMKNTSGNSVFHWICRLNELFPGDTGILSPAILNLVELAPGQAMALPAGRLHAYLHGMGIELMANSDNVIRGGLTTKHIDTKELLSVVTFASSPVEILEGKKNGALTLFMTGAAEYELTEINIRGPQAYTAPVKRNVEILLIVDGQGEITTEDSALKASRGDVFLVPAAAPAYRITGTCRIFRAGVPL